MCLPTADNNPVASTDSYARLGKRSVGSFKLTATENAASPGDLALIWSQSVLNPKTDKAESWLCAGRFGKSGQQLYVSYPEQVVQIPDDFTPSAFDGYLDQDNLHVVYALSDIGNDGTAVMRNDVKFTNSVRVKDCVVVAANATSADNVDKRVDHTDMQAIISHISGKPSGQFSTKTADVNGDGKITIADIIGVISIIKR